MIHIRAAAKGAVESILGSRAAFALAARRLRGARLVLAYHNVVAADHPPSLGDRSLHLPLASFRSQLDLIAEAGFSVVMAAAPAPAPDAPPQVVITFDDAYAAALAHAVPELADRGLPATIFVAPGLLGLESPWWDRLADPSEGVVPKAIRDTALRELAGDGARILARAATEGWPFNAVGPDHRIATEQELEAALARHPDLTLGAHTWDHPNVAALAAERLERELREPLRWLRARWPTRVVAWLAYPYGLESAGARSAAARCGYDGAFLIAGGWYREPAPAQAIPRFNVTPGLSARGFRARLADLL